MQSFLKIIFGLPIWQEIERMWLIRPEAEDEKDEEGLFAQLG
jgi:hypothetical protein